MTVRKKWVEFGADPRLAACARIRLLAMTCGTSSSTLYEHPAAGTVALWMYHLFANLARA